jgi:hypothetical protein
VSLAQVVARRGSIVRARLAFVLAPLWVPVIAVIWMPSVTVLWISVVVGYGGMLILGLPIFLALRANGWTGGWIAVPVGVLCGMAMWMVTGALFALLLGQGLSGAYATMTDPGWRRGLLTAAVIGVAATVTFWLIARPDRPRSSN